MGRALMFAQVLIFLFIGCKLEEYNGLNSAMV